MAARQSCGPAITPCFQPGSSSAIPGAKLLASPWPPTIDMACVEQNIRGPGTRPAWIAFRSAMSLKPHEATLRTVVKPASPRSEEHTSELQSLRHLVCRLLLEKKKKTKKTQP